MDAKINIAKILKDKPQGTKLYSSACGKCELKEADDKSFKVSFYSSKFGFMNGGEGIFDKNGNLYDDGECIVFPSKEMRDWSKFAWKKGDVLVSNDGKCKVIFERFDDDTYTSFVGKYYVECYGKNDELQDYEEEHYGDTVNYTKESEEAAQTYINTIEERLDGKLNMETLEIDKTQPKAWDAEKKQIVDLKPKCEFKPFDKVLSRRCSEDYWVLNFYSHKTDYYHVCIDGSSNLDCIPYNEETAHLLGTTDDWEGGEQ